VTDKLTLATRRSPLALKQADLTRDFLAKALPGTAVEVLEVVTTGDRKISWSLEKEGGKGLFTKELEDALLCGEADIAVHSAKDLPTEHPAGLDIAGYLPRAAVNDVLVVRADIETPEVIATSSPRRRAQAQLLYPRAVWTEIRGNVDTRLKKIVSGQADATILAQAGLNRLGITAWPGIRFVPLAIPHMVPAVGQGAVALQTRIEDVPAFANLLDAATARAVTIERKFLSAWGGGCHTAFAAHYIDGKLWVFHERVGIRAYPFRVALQGTTSAIDEELQGIVEGIRGKSDS